MKSVAAIACALSIVACAKSPDPKSPIKQGKTCGSGSNAIVCASNQSCGRAPAPPPLNRTEPVRPEDPVGSDLEGPCGGVAGFHCRDGLTCEMPANQENVADGMGTCVLPWACVNGSF